MTNLDATTAPAAAFAALYHQRWRIEEAFKRLKCRLHLEAVSGLSQHALLIDVAAKVLADNIATLLGRTADEPDTASRQCQPTYAIAAMRAVLPRVLLAVGDVIALLDDALRMIADPDDALSAAAPRPGRHAVSSRIRISPTRGRALKFAALQPGHLA